LLYVARVVAFPNVAHVGGGEFGIGAPFGVSVVRIICVRSKKQMVGVDATPIIAVMANAYPVRDVTDMESVADAVRVLGFGVVRKRSVPVTVDAARPGPALAFCFSIDVSPEAFFWIADGVQLSVSAQLHIMRLAEAA